MGALKGQESIPYQLLVFLIRVIFAQQSSSPHSPTWTLVQSQYIHQAESLPSTPTFLKCIIATTFIDHNLFLTLLHNFSSAAASLMNEEVFDHIVKSGSKSSSAPRSSADPPVKCRLVTRNLLCLRTRARPNRSPTTDFHLVQNLKFSTSLCLHSVLLHVRLKKTFTSYLYTL